MFDKISSILNKEFSGLHQAAFLLAFTAFIAQLLGLLRDRLLASTFGAGIELDIYYLAFKIPDILFVGFASFVSVTVLIPFILRHKKEGEEKVKIFLSETMTMFVIVMIVVSLCIFLLMPYLVELIAPGFSKESLDTLINLARLLLLSPIILGLSNLFGSITQSHRRFLAYTLSPVIYNLGIIIGIIFFYPLGGLYGLGWGVVLGAVGHLLVQFPSVYSLRLLPKFKLIKNWPEIKKVILVSIPRTVTLSVHQLSLLVLISIGSILTAGSIAIFNLAFNLQSFPLTLIGVSYSVAAFPTLAGYFEKGYLHEFSLKIEVAIKNIFFWSLPAISLFIVLRSNIVEVIFGTGNFTDRDVMLTGAALSIFVVSVVAQALVQLFVRTYYAASRTKIPLIFNVLSSVLVIVLAFVFLKMYQSGGMLRDTLNDLFNLNIVNGGEVMVLPLAYSAGLLLNALLYWVIFQRHFTKFSAKVYLSILNSLVGAFVVFGISFWLLDYLGQFNLHVFIEGLIAGLGGILFGFITLLYLKSEELAYFLNRLKLRFFNK